MFQQTGTREDFRFLGHRLRPYIVVETLNPKPPGQPTPRDPAGEPKMDGESEHGEERLWVPVRLPKAASGFHNGLGFL